MKDTLPSRIRKLLEFDYSRSRIAYQNHKWPKNETETISQHTFWTQGQQAESDRTKELTEALVECVDASRRLVLQCVSIGSWESPGIRPRECVCSTCETKQALTNLTRLVERLERE